MWWLHINPQWEWRSTQVLRTREAWGYSQVPRLHCGEKDYFKVRGQCRWKRCGILSSPHIDCEHLLPGNTYCEQTNQLFIHCLLYLVICTTLYIIFVYMHVSSETSVIDLILLLYRGWVSIVLNRFNVLTQLYLSFRLLIFIRLGWTYARIITLFHFIVQILLMNPQSEWILYFNLPCIHNNGWEAALSELESSSVRSTCTCCSSHMIKWGCRLAQAPLEQTIIAGCYRKSTGIKNNVCSLAQYTGSWHHDDITSTLSCDNIHTKFTIYVTSSHNTVTSSTLHGVWTNLVQTFMFTGGWQWMTKC